VRREKKQKEGEREPSRVTQVLAVHCDVVVGPTTSHLPLKLEKVHSKFGSDMVYKYIPKRSYITMTSSESLHQSSVEVRPSLATLATPLHLRKVLHSISADEARKVNVTNTLPAIRIRQHQETQTICSKNHRSAPPMLLAAKGRASLVIEE